MTQKKLKDMTCKISLKVACELYTNSRGHVACLVPDESKNITAGAGSQL